MSEPSKYQEWILETIDSLRSRKARPDLERICRMVRRRHGSDPDRTRTELDKLIQEQTVLKVSYKGSISYRNAAKVQRKSRKKSEFTAAGSSSGGRGGGGGGGAERTEHHPNNNGDSTHSFTDQEEEEEEEEEEPHTQTGSKKLKLGASSGNGSVGGGATPGCTSRSGWKEEEEREQEEREEEERASAPRDEGAGPRGERGCPGQRICSQDGADAPTKEEGGGGGGGGGKEPGGSGDDTRRQTCCSSPGPLRRLAQTDPHKPQLRAGLGGSRAASARIPGSSTSSSSSSSSSSTRGQVKPLGLKEILGYLSSQERLSEEKLTRGKVRVVMEREVARGRLRRSRCGNITLPPRGEEVAEEQRRHRLPKSSLQDRKSPSPSLQEAEPMETASQKEERRLKKEEEEVVEEGKEEEDQEDPQSCKEEGLSPVAMTTKPGLIDKTIKDAEIQTSSKQHGGKGFQRQTQCPPAAGAFHSRCDGPHWEERAAAPQHLHMELSEIDHSSSGFNGVECKTEVGVSSCLLTPTASPRDSSPPEERGFNVTGGELLKTEGASGSLVDWTVSDVVTYFTAAGFPEQAAAFRTQEIDGKSLLLMQRNDVLTGLSIRLGPALKIYERHVKVLQKTHFEDEDS